VLVVTTYEYIKRISRKPAHVQALTAEERQELQAAAKICRRYTGVPT
jgi:hypothetical protein